MVRGDATSPPVVGPKIVAHVCNDIGRWSQGFVQALSRRWPEPEQDYRAWHRGRSGNDFGLGAVRLVQVEPDIWVANMIAQRGIRTARTGPAIRHDALERCLTTLAHQAAGLGASVHMPRIGCGLAGGRWEDLEPIITRSLCAHDIRTVVYDI
jgi:O-acetyl-ADP-ribose deacetylase (regulator of RNase III)